MTGLFVSMPLWIFIGKVHRIAYLFALARMAKIIIIHFIYDAHYAWDKGFVSNSVNNLWLKSILCFMSMFWLVNQN